MKREVNDGKDKIELLGKLLDASNKEKEALCVEMDGLKAKID